MRKHTRMILINRPRFRKAGRPNIKTVKQLFVVSCSYFVLLKLKKTTFSYIFLQYITDKSKYLSSKDHKTITYCCIHKFKLFIIKVSFFSKVKQRIFHKKHLIKKRKKYLNIATNDGKLNKNTCRRIKKST